MILVQLAILLAMILIGSRLKGIGLGVMGMSTVITRPGPVSSAATSKADSQLTVGPTMRANGGTCTDSWCKYLDMGPHLLGC